MLIAIASWLESSDNEALILSEYNEDCCKIVAESCVQAAEILKIAALQTDELEPEPESVLTEESLSGLASIANEFDNSGDPELKKQASVIDELLLTISASKDYVKIKKAQEAEKIDRLKKNYNDTKTKSDELAKKDVAEKNIDKSDYYKKVDISSEPLQTRYCPDHAGVMARRISDMVIQCPLDKKQYDFENGFSLMDGTRIPGRTVSNQTKLDTHEQASIFSTRQDKLNG